MKLFTEIQPYLYSYGETTLKHYLTFTKKGDIGVGYKLTLKEVNTLSSDDINFIRDIFNQAILGLPVGSVVHRQDYFFKKKHEGTNLDRVNFLYNEHEKYFYEREFLDHQGYLYISLMSDSYINRNARSTIFSGGNATLAKKNKAEEFLNAVEKFEYQLSKTQIKLEPLTRADNIKLKYKYFTLSNDANTIADFSFEDNIRVGDKIVDILSINDTMHLPIEVPQVYKVHELSTERSTAVASLLYPITFKLQCDHIINTVIQRVDEEKMIDKVKFENKNKVRGLARFSLHNKKIFNANDIFIQEAEDDFFNACKMHFNLITISNSPKERSKIKKEAEIALSEIGVMPVNNKIRLGNIFWGCAPFNAGDLPQEVMSNSFVQIASCFNNWETNYKSAIDGVVLYDRLYQKPVVLDMWDKPYKEKIISNRNCFLIGYSGEGKSVLLNHLFSQYLEQDYALVILDIGDSYKKLCELYGGLYYKYDREKPLFNPFIAENNKPDADFIESLTDLLFTSWKRKGDDATREEESVIKLALKSYYRHLEENILLTPSFDSFYDYYEKSCAEKDRKLGDNIFNVESFLLIMKDYCSGEIYGNVFNGDRNINIKEDRFIVFELDNIKDNKVLFPIVSHVITHTINNTIFKKEGVKKAIWIDEAWKVIENPALGIFVKYLFKTIRKKEGQVGIAVQDITDIPENDIGTTILNNSAIKIFMPHVKNINSIPLVSKRTSLMKKAETLLYSLNSNVKDGYTELLIILGSESKAYRLELSPYSYYAFTSDQDDNVQIYNHAKEQGSIKNAIIKMVETKNK